MGRCDIHIIFYLIAVYRRIYAIAFSLVPIPVFYRSLSPTKEAILHRFVKNMPKVKN
jgi:hypothetical protein